MNSEEHKDVVDESVKVVTETEVTDVVEENNINHTNDVNDKKIKFNFKNNKILIIVIIVIIIVVLVCLALSLVGNGGEEEPYLTDPEVEEGEVVNIDVRNIRDFSEYKNFNIKYVDHNIGVSNSVDVDIINKIMSASLTQGYITMYTYYDLSSQMHYFSSNGIDWSKNVNNQVKLPNYSSIINKVKSGAGVINKGNGQFHLTTTARLFSTVYDNVNTIVYFDNDGFLKAIAYDLSGTIVSDDTYVVSYQFSNVNQLSKVEIPNNVINSATDSSFVVGIEFSE